MDQKDTRKNDTLKLTGTMDSLVDAAFKGADERARKQRKARKKRGSSKRKAAK